MTDAYYEAQRAVIATVFIKDELLDPLTVELGLSADDFCEPYKRVFAAMVELRDRRESVNEVSVAYHLGVPQEEIVVFAGLVPQLAEWRTHARIVLDEAEWQRRKNALHSVQNAIDSRDQDAFDQARNSLDAVPQLDQGTYTPEQLADEFYDWLTSETVSAIPTGFRVLDNALAGGLRRGDTTIIGAWTSMGKSVLIDQILEHGYRNGFTTCVYINEMERTDRVGRTVARLSTVPYHRIATKELTVEDNTQILQVIKALPSTLVEVPGWSAQKIARHVRKQKSDLAAVDLATRIPAKDTSDWDIVSGTLTDAARQSGTHLLLVCQLNNERNKTIVKPPPVMRDLRNTGSWGNDAANVLFLHRDQETLASVDVARPKDEGHIRIEKARHGRVGEMVSVVFNAERMRFDEVSVGW